MTPSPEGKAFPEPDSLHYERVFRQDKTDAFLLLQLRDTPETAEIRFENLQYLEKKGFTVSYENYAAVYAGDLTPSRSRQENLDDLYTRFNIDRPPDFTGHSLSVSDIIVLRQQGQITCHYVDSWGFQELPRFLPENYLKNAEMAMEDDYSMIDGINPEEIVIPKKDRHSSDFAYKSLKTSFQKRVIPFKFRDNPSNYLRPNSFLISSSSPFHRESMLPLVSVFASVVPIALLIAARFISVSA